METFNVVKEILTLIIAGAGVWVAWSALKTWKKEFIGKKKIDLACDIVEQACNMQNFINNIRNPICDFSEKEKIIEILSKENKQINKNKVIYLIPRMRMHKYKNDIEKFFSLKNKAQLYWDKEIIDLFYELNNIFQSIYDYSEFLYTQLMPQDTINKATKIIFYSKDNDEIVVKVQKIVDEFKLNLYDCYKDGLTKWKKLK